MTGEVWKYLNSRMSKHCRPLEILTPPRTFHSLTSISSPSHHCHQHLQHKIPPLMQICARLTHWLNNHLTNRFFPESWTSFLAERLDVSTSPGVNKSMNDIMKCVIKVFKQAQLGVPPSRILVELGFILQAGSWQIINFAQNPRAKVFKAQN